MEERLVDSTTLSKKTAHMSRFAYLTFESDIVEVFQPLFK